MLVQASQLSPQPALPFLRKLRQPARLAPSARGGYPSSGDFASASLPGRMRCASLRSVRGRQGGTNEGPAAGLGRGEAA